MHHSPVREPITSFSEHFDLHMHHVSRFARCADGIRTAVLAANASGALTLPDPRGPLSPLGRQLDVNRWHVASDYQKVVDDVAQVSHTCIYMFEYVPFHQGRIVEENDKAAVAPRLAPCSIHPFRCTTLNPCRVHVYCYSCPVQRYPTRVASLDDLSALQDKRWAHQPSNLPTPSLPFLPYIPASLLSTLAPRRLASPRPLLPHYPTVLCEGTRPTRRMSSSP
jgi:hypothetical protein